MLCLILLFNRILLCYGLYCINYPNEISKIIIVLDLVNVRSVIEKIILIGFDAITMKI